MRAKLDNAALGLAPFSHGFTTAAIAALFALVLVIFNVFPELDRGASRLFFAPIACDAEKAASTICGYFPARDSAAFLALRQWLQYIPPVAAIVLAIVFVRRLAQGFRLDNAWMVRAAVVLATFILSVGVVVNGLLKEFWGRPRPIQTDIFGGAAPFVPAGEITNYCLSNCSFVSGESAAAFWLICLVAMLPGENRSARALAYAVALAFAVVTSVLRISFGAHYISDAISAGLVTLLTYSLLSLIARRHYCPKL